jgi:hypothetical protein
VAAAEQANVHAALEAHLFSDTHLLVRKNVARFHADQVD